MIKLLIPALLLATTSCSYSIKHVDTSKAQPSCVRECSKTYSECSGQILGYNNAAFTACGESYEVCISTCPAK